MIAAGAFAGLVAGAGAAVAVIAFRHGVPGHFGGAPKNGTIMPNSPMNTTNGSERDTVPDACTTLGTNIAASLAPGADRTRMSQATESDRHSECVWGLYGASHSRQLTIELRALTASGPVGAIDVAVRTFHGEWRSDRAGRGLADSVTVKDSHGVSGVGEQAYVVYTVGAHGRIGAAVANARLANVLVTVHYSGGDDLTGDGRPMSAGTATDGALAAARDIISTLQSRS